MSTYYAFGAIWLFFTITALGQYVVSYATVVYKLGGTVWSFPLLHGYWNWILYHLGTCAFGAFVIGFAKVIFVIIEFLVKQTKNTDGSTSEACMVMGACITCCLGCMTELMQWLNELVYADCAINASDYPDAAKNVISTVAVNPVTYGLVKASTQVVRFLGIVFITCSGTALAYFMQSDKSLHSLMQTGGLAASNMLGITGAACTICFCTSLAFMNVFQQAAETVMYCIIWQQKHGKAGAHDVPDGWQEGSQDQYTPMPRSLTARGV